MFSKKGLFFLFVLTLFYTSQSLAQTSDENQETLENSLELLKNYFIQNKNWHVVQPEVGENVSGLINFIQDKPIDEIISELEKARSIRGNYVLRLPENVEDSLSVPGYISASETQNNILQIQRAYRNEVDVNAIQVPLAVIDNALSEIDTVGKAEGIRLFTDSIYAFPDSLIIPEVIPDSVLNSPEQFQLLVRKDSLRAVFIESKRLQYNDSIKAEHIGEAVRIYRQNKYEQDLNLRIKRYRDSVKISNYQTLKEYNDAVVHSVNDSIKIIIDVLSSYADYIDTTRISFFNSTGDESDVLLQNDGTRYTRVWLKNEQNDSLRVMVKNVDKRSVQMLIDDGATISRFKERGTKDFDFSTLKKDYKKFRTIGKSYELETPWRIGGEGNAGFTQTYLDNWQKGGNSSLAILIQLKGFANYSSKDGKIKWENTGEIRNGWMRIAASDEDGAELRKNDDKFEITSRYGISAFKKWYYSAEFNFNTQFFRGYKYPKADNPQPFSAFMAPSKTFLKVGLDYKPNKNFSLFLSPLTVKNVYVRDTSLIDQTKYGVENNRKAFWEPGLNADLTYKTTFWESVSYETKYKMFINYQDPFRKFDVNWENLFKMPLNDFIDIRLMAQFIYDDDVKFPVYDDEGAKIGEEAKLQIKEFFSIGFTYKINHKVMRTHRIR